MARLYYLNQRERRTPQYQAPMQAWENADAVVAQVRSFIAGVLADGAVNEAEAKALNQFLQSRRAAIEQVGFPLEDLARRVALYSEDGFWTPEELTELKDELDAFSNKTVGEQPERSSLSIFTKPTPTLVYPGSEFVITGNFAFGTRNQVLKVIEERGGIPHERPRQSTKYVIVGSFVSEGWAHGNYGRKIEAAMDLRASGLDVSIVSEEDWKKSL
jgi:NAD-dependent DNA ligase